LLARSSKGECVLEENEYVGGREETKTKLSKMSGNLIEIISDKQRQRARLARIRERSIAADDALMSAVTEIVEEVRRRGDVALLDFTARFDGVRLRSADLRVGETTLRETAARVDARVLEALRASIRNIRAFHERERVESWEMVTCRGVRLGQRITPVESAGLYVPGGTASYPSSVVMNVVPAQVAGVRRIAVVTPPRTLYETPAVAAALLELGVTEIYQVGGAQSIAALAYGTETIGRVDFITGPGNKFVAAAKKLVFGTVGIDSIAGPSEVVVLADSSARADFIAADLLAQAEHGEDASAVLVTNDTELAARVAAEVARQIETLPRRTIITRSLADFGAIFVVESLEEACETVNELAPEHLEIIARDADGLAARVRHAGAIFFGAHAPEAVGDYFAGPNHVLPTGGAARFSSALGLHDFLRRTSIIRYTRAELNETARMIAALAEAEGLEAHARSALIRIKE
jgi:histidinol dehydrogenase